MSRIADALDKAGKPLRGADQPEATLDAFDSIQPIAPAPIAPASTAPRRSAGEASIRLGKPNAAASGLAACATDERLVVSPKMSHTALQQYRRLASTLHQLQIERGLRSLIITSAVAGEGKTMTAANLALTLSESLKRRVLLIDADLRRPVLDKIFKTRSSPGLSNMLASTEPVARVVAVSERLTLLAGGRPEHDPSAVLTSDRMRLLVEDAVKSFDWVLIDTPPAGVFSDASLLSMLTDGVLMVIRASSTPLAQIQRGIAAVTPERIVGTVLNQTENITMQQYGYDEAEKYSGEPEDGTDPNSRLLSLTDVARTR
jgi:capsular exopolysaccharide synthesis family protein